MGRIVSTVQVLRGGRCSVGSDDVFCAYDAIHGVQFVAAHEGTPVFVSALNFKWATLFYLSIRSLLELRLHPVPNWGQARLMRLGQTGMSVKLLSLGKGLVQGHYSARGVGKARWCWPQYSGFDFVGPGSLHVCVREKVCANWQDHSLSDSQCSQPLCQP